MPTANVIGGLPSDLVMTNLDQENGHFCNQGGERRFRRWGVLAGDLRAIESALTESLCW